MEIGCVGISRRVLIGMVPSERIEQKRHRMENTFINDFLLIYFRSSLSPISAYLLWPLQTGLRVSGRRRIARPHGAGRWRESIQETEMSTLATIILFCHGLKKAHTVRPSQSP
jgi:hypothetical protein